MKGFPWSKQETQHLKYCLECDALSEIDKDNKVCDICGSKKHLVSFNRVLQLEKIKYIVVD